MVPAKTHKLNDCHARSEAVIEQKMLVCFLILPDHLSLRLLLLLQGAVLRRRSLQKSSLLARLLPRVQREPRRRIDRRVSSGVTTLGG